MLHRAPAKQLDNIHQFGSTRRCFSAHLLRARGRRAAPVHKPIHWRSDQPLSNIHHLEKQQSECIQRQERQGNLFFALLLSWIFPEQKRFGHGQNGKSQQPIGVLRIFYSNPLQNQLVAAMVGYGYLWLFYGIGRWDSDSFSGHTLHQFHGDEQQLPTDSSWGTLGGWGFAISSFGIRKA